MLRAALAMHRTLVALQRGDAPAMTSALEYATARYRELRHGELLWHCERFAALASINAGAWTIGVAWLETLHRRAEQRVIFGTEPFCAFDRAVIFGEFVDTAALDDGVRSSLEYDASEPPSVWAFKVRALATAGLSGEARAALSAVTVANLAKLPCDRDYLGTLGHLARAALLLNALDYAEAIYPLLEPYPEHFASQVSFLCEGSVSQLLGMLAHALGRRERAVAHLEAGIDANERAGFAPRAAEARLQLALCLLDQGTASTRAHALAQEAHARATQLGMQRLARAAAAVLQPTAAS
jgi:tetratricopeptide (TPR) repeat protein